jgi:hypothetical protein
VVNPSPPNQRETCVMLCMYVCTILYVSLVQNDGEIDRDVKNIMNTVWMKWRQVSGTTCDRRIPLLKEKSTKRTIDLSCYMDQNAGQLR